MTLIEHDFGINSIHLTLYELILSQSSSNHNTNINKTKKSRRKYYEKIEEVPLIIFLAKKIQLVSWHKILQRKLITNLSGTRKLTKNIF